MRQIHLLQMGLDDYDMSVVGQSVQTPKTKSKLEEDIESLLMQLGISYQWLSCQQIQLSNSMVVCDISGTQAKQMLLNKVLKELKE